MKILVLYYSMYGQILKGKQMNRKIMLAICVLSLSLVFGCEEQKKSASEIKEIQQKQAKELEYSIAGTCEGCDTRWTLDVSPRDLVIAENPGIDNQVLYLTVVGKDGKPMQCCNKPMRIVVRNNGKLALYCPSCGKLKPIAVQGDKVVVETE
jgi:hypothetical protein